jgi:hypothetical protein
MEFSGTILSYELGRSAPHVGPEQPTLLRQSLNRKATSRPQRSCTNQFLTPVSPLGTDYNLSVVSIVHLCPHFASTRVNLDS